MALSTQPSARLTALLVSPDSALDGGGGFGVVLMLSGTAALSVDNLAVQDSAASGSDRSDLRSADGYSDRGSPAPMPTGVPSSCHHGR